MTSIDFGNLFKVELLHKFYSDQVCPDFEVVPSVKTRQVINGYKAIARQYKNQLYTGMKTMFYKSPQPGDPQPQLKPFIPVEEGMQMTFFMNLVNPTFINYSNLPLAATPGKIYYFTNRNNNVNNLKNFLSAKMTVYNSLVTYKPGDVVVDGAGTVFCAIRSSGQAQPFDTTQADHWMVIDNNQYASVNDLLQWLPSISTYTLNLAASFADISVLGYESGTGTYTNPVITEKINFTGALPSFKLDLSSLSPGKYSLSVNGVQQWIYINEELKAGLPLAVIDIFNDTTPASCQLINLAGQLTSPVYTVYFLNRATIWKYTLVSTTAGSITGSSNPYTFANTANAVSASTFISLTPIPLSDTPLKFTLTLNNAINNLTYKHIACADVQRLSTIQQNGDNYLCSEIFLNH